MIYKSTAIYVMAFVITAVGYLILAIENPMIAAGCVIVHWGINCENAAAEMKAKGE